MANVTDTSGNYFTNIEYRDLFKNFLTSINKYESSEVVVKSYDEEEWNVMEDKSSSILCAILKDACDQITVLGGSDTDERNVSLNVTDVQAKAREYHTNNPVYDRDSSEPYRIAFNKQKIRKLTKDSLYVKEVLTRLIFELKHDNTYTVLTNLLYDLKECKSEENNLELELIDNVNRMNEIKCGLINDEKEHNKHMEAHCKDIAVMIDTLEDIYFENILRKRYIVAWEIARTEQTQDLCVQAESELNSTISKFRKKIEREIRVNAEIEMFLRDNEIEIENGIIFWRKQYDKEVEHRQVRLTIMREKRETQDNELLQLKGVYELRKKQIDEYLIYKKIKRIHDEKQAYLASKATKIQAWWRGLMVRRQLGRFSPKKPKKGKKK